MVKPSCNSKPLKKTRTNNSKTIREASASGKEYQGSISKREGISGKRQQAEAGVTP